MKKYIYWTNISSGGTKLSNLFISSVSPSQLYLWKNQLISKNEKNEISKNEKMRHVPL